MRRYRNIKIHVPTPEISEAVQKKLFEDGCLLEFDGKVVKRERVPFLYVDKYGYIRWGGCASGFVEKGYKEVQYQSILNPYYDVKIAWANGKVVQRIIQAENGEKWVDWNYSSHLDIEAGYDWRIKPKTKTIKQWERKFWDGENVNMARSTDKNPDWDVGLDWVGEPELKEYEVPND